MEWFRLRSTRVLPAIDIIKPALLVPLFQIHVAFSFERDRVDTQIVMSLGRLGPIIIFNLKVLSLRLPNLLQLALAIFSACPFLDVKLILLPFARHPKHTHATLLAEVPACFLCEYAVVAKLLDGRGRCENEVVGGRDGAAVKKSHLVAYGAITLIEFY